MKYLHQFEDGSMNQTSAEPTQEELQQVAEGTNQILRFEHGVFEQAVVEEEEILVESEDEEDENPDYDTQYKIASWEMV